MCVRAVRDWGNVYIVTVQTVKRYFKFSSEVCVYLVEKLEAIKCFKFDYTRVSGCCILPVLTTCLVLIINIGTLTCPSMLKVEALKLNKLGVRYICCDDWCPWERDGNV